jgi:hypothetical protein
MRRVRMSGLPVVVLVALLAATAAACDVGDSGGPPSIRIRDASVDAGERPDEDQDRDGLCDATEAEYGSSPLSPDTDGDGLPDFVELIYGLGATDPGSPDPDQLGYMQARFGAEAGFDIRLTGSGTGSDFIGFFEDLSAPYDDGTTAGSYFVTSEAISAEPAEAVRTIVRSEQRFISVLGTVRLELFALFRADPTIDEEGCARAYPFRYRLKDDLGDLVDERTYLLIVAGTGRDTPDDFCVPMPCL